MTDTSDRLSRLIEKGEAVLTTHQPNPPGAIGFPTLHVGDFAEWRNQALVCLSDILPSGHLYTASFEKQVRRGYRGTVEAGLGILRAATQDLEAKDLGGQTDSAVGFVPPLHTVEQIAERFHQIARQIRSRHGNRPTLDISDEYDVQDLLHALLRLHFDDVRAEEYTPSYAGKSSRMDFLLRNEEVVVEVKMSRKGLGAKEIGSQLLEDIGRYESHPHCGALVCFVYDPDGYVSNPRGLEADLSRDEPTPVRIYVRP